MAGLFAAGALGAHPGEATYATTCGVCHEYGAAGAPRTGEPEDWAKRIAQGKEVLYRHAIQGFRGMPARGANPDLSDKDVRNAVDFLLHRVK